jgi:DNA-binding transcriptional ArsR family regulator
MQIVETPHSPGTVTVIGPSLALDLSWVAHSAWSPRLRVQHPVLGVLAAEHPETIRSLQDFWEDGTDCFPELQVLTHTAGAHEEIDFDGLFEALGSARSQVPQDLALRSEAERDRLAICSRLARLRDDDRRWADYVELFRAVYLPIDPWWHSTGIPAVEQAVLTIRRELDRGADWTRMISNGCTMMEEQLPQIIDRPEPVLLVLCALFGQALYFDLPGCQLVGLGAGLGEELGARARTGDLARRVRVLADPTRLAILDHLRAGPRSVGEVAVDFGLSQPTVSVHIKQLRQAGLLTATRRGPRLELSVDSEAFHALVGELNTIVAV